jgi:hypothetical protein
LKAKRECIDHRYHAAAFASAAFAQADLRQEAGFPRARFSPRLAISST